jgi:hypothetical protein
MLVHAYNPSTQEAEAYIPKKKIENGIIKRFFTLIFIATLFTRAKRWKKSTVRWQLNG